MLRKIAPLALLALIVPSSSAGANAYQPPVLPEVRKHLADGWACLQRDPDMARAHAQAVLLDRDVRVELNLSEVPGDRRTACRAAVDAALETWQGALGDIRLSRVGDNEHGGIVVRFRPDVTERGVAVAGFVNWRRSAKDGAGRVTGDVQVRTMNLDGTAMSNRAMRHIVMHEMGHLLGLDDTDRAGEAMGPLDVNRPASAPSEAEVAAVRALREEAERLMRNAR